MITETTTKHQFGLDEKDKVIELLKDALDDPDFYHYNVFLGTEWKGLTEKRPVFAVSIDRQFKTKPNDNPQTTN